MDQFKEIRQTEKKYASIAISIAIFVGLALILLSFKALGKGLILGTLFSVFNFIIAGETLPMRLGITRNRAILISGGSILMRYVLLAIPLIMSIKMPQYNLATTVIGLFMIQGLILVEQMSRVIFSSTPKHLDY